MGMPVAARRFTVDEYHRMADAGIFHQDDRVELLDGEILVMTPIGSYHAGVVARVESLLHRAVGDRAIVWVQNPIHCGPYSEPQPDICLLRLRDNFYTDRHPEPADVFLVIEVVDTSLRYDRERKVPLYARAGVAEVWLVNLPADSIEANRDPREGRYLEARTARRGESLAPLALPGVALHVDDILG